MPLAYSEKEYSGFFGLLFVMGKMEPHGLIVGVFCEDEMKNENLFATPGSLMPAQDGIAEPRILSVVTS